MERDPHNPDREAARRGDRVAYIWIVVFTILSWIVLSLSAVTDARRVNPDAGWQQSWLLQLTSHVAALVAILIIPILLHRFPISLENWARRIPIYVAGFLIFGSVHIGLMMGLRELMFPIVLGYPYGDSIFDLGRWTYELSKDAYTYLLVLTVFISARHIEALQLEARASHAEAKETGRLTLKSGGRIIFLNAREVIWAKAAQNYVEIHTLAGEHLVRMTLSNLNALLGDAGDNHVRTHRSYIVRRDAIREITPTGDGDARITLTTGTDIPISRKYRPALEVAKLS